MQKPYSVEVEWLVPVSSVVVVHAASAEDAVKAALACDEDRDLQTSWWEAASPDYVAGLVEGDFQGHKSLTCVRSDGPRLDLPHGTPSAADVLLEMLLQHADGDAIRRRLDAMEAPKEEASDTAEASPAATKRYVIALDPREFDTVLAALRNWQQTVNRDETPEYEIACGEHHDPLDDDAMDQLCEALNTGGCTPAPKPSDASEDYWGERPDVPIADWQDAVAHDDTRLGYWEFVQARLQHEEGPTHGRLPDGSVVAGDERLRTVDAVPLRIES